MKRINKLSQIQKGDLLLWKTGNEIILEVILSVEKIPFLARSFVLKNTASGTTKYFIDFKEFKIEKSKIYKLNGK